MMRTREFVIEREDLMKEWDWEKNNKLELYPNEISFGSTKKVWWKCPSCGYEWQTAPNNRTSTKTGCPYCAGKVVIPGKNDLQTLYPEIAKKWHPTKNDMHPWEVAPFSNKKAWWICEKDPRHEFEDPIYHITKGAVVCPICANQKIIIGVNDFQTTNPELMKEWKNEKDYRKLMDFNEEFNDFPETVEDILNNPAQYLYDSDELVVESGKKIDDLTGKKLFDSAVKCIKEKENEKAAKLLKELLHYNYSVPETEYLLALAEFKNGNTDSAMKYLQRSDRKNKNPYLIAKNSELKGEIYFSQNKYDKAYECFINAIIGVNSKQDAELYNKAGIAALRAGNIENARNAWKIGKYLGNRDAKRNLLWLDH